MTTIKTSVAKALHTLMLSLMLLSLPEYALADIPTCGNIKISVTSKDSPCSDNGQIKVVANGDDIENGNFTNVEFRVYLSDTPPPFVWTKATQEGNQYSYTFIGLEAGIYTVDVRGSCKNNPDPYVYHLNVKTDVLISQEDWLAINGRIRFERGVLELEEGCVLNDGAVKFTDVIGGKAPYTLIVESYPDDYKGIRTKTFDTLSHINNYILDGLSAGDYTFVIRSGDYCGSYITMDMNIPIATPRYKRFLIDSLAHSGHYEYDYVNPDSKFNHSVMFRKSLVVYNMSNASDPITQTEGYYYNKVSDKHFEYNYYRNEDSAKILQQEWKPLLPTNSYSWDYNSRIDGLKYNVDDIVADQDNNKSITIVVRAKKCPDKIFLERPLRLRGFKDENLSPIFSTEKISCNGLDFSLKFNYTSDVSQCFPLKLSLERKRPDADKYETVKIEDDSITYNRIRQNWGYCRYIVTSEDINSSFRYKMVTACGLEIFSKAVLIGEDNFAFRPNMSSSSIYLTGCDNEYIHPYITGDLHALQSVKYVGTQRRKLIQDQRGIHWTEWESADDDPDFPKPTITEWYRSELPEDAKQKYLNSLFFWAKTKDKVIKKFSQNYYGTTMEMEENEIMRDCNYIYNPKKRDAYVYKFIFDIIDSCGYTKQFEVDKYFSTRGFENRGSSSQNIFVEKKTDVKPQVVFLVDCISGKAFVRISNAWDLYKIGVRGSTYYSGSNLRGVIVKSPNGADRGKAIPCRYDFSESPQLSVPGKYYVKLKPHNYDYRLDKSLNTDCYEEIFTFDLTEKDLKFMIDKSASASFRCPNTEVGDQGYIAIKVINGSGGPYLYELLHTDGRDTIPLSKVETSGIGIFDQWAKDHIKSDEYLVRVTDNGCSTKRTFYETVQITKLGIRPMAWADSYNLCVGSTLNLKGLPLGVPDSQYVWTFSGDPEWKMHTQNPSIPDIEHHHSGYYKLSVYVPICQTLFTDSVYITVNSRPLYWNPSARNGDWYNVDNWLYEDGSPSRTFPSSCTNVHIPGRADHYPNLSPYVSPILANGRATCDTITFHYGSEMSHTTLLHYNYARVQYNFGYYGTSNPVDLSQPANNAESSYPAIGSRPLPVMLRNKWYMLAMPLKKMVSGDFSLAGYPNTFQRVFNSFTPDTGVTPKENYTLPFEKQDFDLSGHNNALSVSVWSYHSQMPGASDHKILESMKGVIELPHILDKRKESFYPLHTYNVLDSASRFNYYDYETLEPLANSTKKIYRGYDASRFVYENSLNVPDKKIEGDEEVSIYQMPIKNSTHGRKIMIGNPLMTSIDFNKLWEENYDVIRSHYYITEASTGDTLMYTVGLDDDSPLRFIPPLQAFIVERKNPVNNDKINFYLSGDKSILRTDDQELPKPRNMAAKPVNNGWALMSLTSIDRVTRHPQTKTQRLLFNKADGLDIPFYVESGNLERDVHFFIMDDEGKFFTDLNDSPSTKTKLYNMGIVSLNKEVMNLKLSVGGKCVKNVKLIDNYLHKTIDVTNGFDYKFYHRTNLISGIEGSDLCRFQLLVTFK